MTYNYHKATYTIHTPEVYVYSLKSSLYRNTGIIMTTSSILDPTPSILHTHGAVQRSTHWHTRKREDLLIFRAIQSCLLLLWLRVTLRHHCGYNNNNNNRLSAHSVEFSLQLPKHINANGSL